MKCPVCKDVDLLMSERQGVEIDYCPQCRGVWLDRGELDKIIERAVPASRAPERAEEPHRAHAQTDRQGDRPQVERQEHSDSRGTQPRRRESFLSDLFDFD